LLDESVPNTPLVETAKSVSTNIRFAR